MSRADNSQVEPRFLSIAMAAFIRIAAVVMLVFWCYQIVAPFIHVIVWGLIISVGAYPPMRRPLRL